MVTSVLKSVSVIYRIDNQVFDTSNINVLFTFKGLCDMGTMYTTINGTKNRRKLYIVKCGLGPFKRPLQHEAKLDIYS